MSAERSPEILMKPGERTVEAQERARQGVLWGVLILVLAAVSGAGVWSLFRDQSTVPAPLSGASPRLPVYGSIADFSLVERSGRHVQLSDLRDQIWIANFIFTNCPDECPLMTAKMAELQANFADTAAVRLVSISVDPERDTPAVLSRYADRFGAGPERWLFLTGEKEAIDRLVRDGFRLPVVDPLLISSFAPASHGGGKDPGHATRFVLVDRWARIRGYYDSTEEEALHRLREHVHTLLWE